MIMYIDHTERETSKHDFFSFPSSNVAKYVCVLSELKQLVMQSKVC